jgi:chemotaxis protein methyltransferase CheR
MVLSDVLNTRPADVKILGTDISTRVLEKCKMGVYSEDKMTMVPPLMRDRYTEKCNVGSAPAYMVKDKIKQMISFSRINLSQPPFPMRGPFDIVFCRNVMIYFDNEVRKKLLDDINRLLKPGGYLLVGHAESLTGMMCGYHAVKPSIYIKK